MVVLKQGVKLEGVKPEILVGLMVADGVYADMGFNCVVTSVSDGKHSKVSKHYTGEAFDLRTRFFTEKQKVQAVTVLRERLTSLFDVVLESDHIHVEYDPK